jgi:hypothetical protein
MIIFLRAAPRTQGKQILSLFTWEVVLYTGKDVERDLVCVKRDLVCVKRDLVCAKRDLVCVKRDLVCVKRDLVCVKRDLVLYTGKDVGR